MTGQKGYVRTIRLAPPSLADNTADAQRLEQHLCRELETDMVRIGPHLIGSLPSKLRTWNFEAKTVLFRDRFSWTVADILDPSSDSPVLGAAIDIGTTRVVVSLIDLETGSEICERGFDNPQKSIAPDVLARIHYAGNQDGLSELQTLIIDGINSHIDEICRENAFSSRDVYLIAGAGNTAMTHLFLGHDPSGIIREPYIPCVNIPDTMYAKDLNIKVNKNAMVFLFPNIGSYFGGDLIAGILFSNLDAKQDPCLMVDVGTNAEIVIGNRDWLIACAGAAGPALEGGVSKIGMTAKPGVIDRVWVDRDSGRLCIHTIDDEKPVGICGSGMIDLAAALFLSGRIDIRGKFSESACKGSLVEDQGIMSFVLVDEKDSGTGAPICLSQVDLNSLTSSKAAMYTILEVIVKNTAGLEFEDLKKFYVAGTFGSFIDPVSAISIGMLPDIPVENFEVLGNSSLGGAKIFLNDPCAFERVMKIRSSITYIELNVNQEFMNMFSGAKFYPHTDNSRFPSVKIMDKVNTVLS